VQTIKQFIRHNFFSPGTEINWYLTISIVYFATHLFALTKLPVFADEAIYIRWTQLIIDDPTRYAFFALNDGKTPLFIWLMLPFQYLFSDQLFAGRFVSVVVGFLQVLLTGAVIRKLAGSRISEMIGMLLVCFLPFWFLHHRMALMDGLLTLAVTTALYYVLQLQTYLAEVPNHSQAIENSVSRTFKAIFTSKLMALLLAGSIALGAALWTKVPAVLSIPPLFVWIFWYPQRSLLVWFNRLLPLGALSFGAFCIFALLSLHPAFGQLFSRGSDFLYPLSEVLAGAWQVSLQQLPTYLSYLTSYLSSGVLILLVFGLFLPSPQRKPITLLVLGGLLFMAPIALMGKVVYARYFLPVAPFFTIAAALVIDILLGKIRSQQNQLTELAKAKKLQAQIVVTISSILIILTVFSTVLPAWLQPNAIPFVPTDRVQYLTEWSSGHGISETVQLIQEAAQTSKIAVATEGYFGTLPDGLLLYLHRKNVQNIWLEGVGQPVHALPATFTVRAKNYDTVWLVVNSHRLQTKLDQEKLVAQFCRPDAAPCLQVWDITADLDRLTAK
jgi:hypothetical protein